MVGLKLALAPILAAVLVLAACAPPQSRTSQSSALGAQSSPKRITAAIMGDPHTLYQKLNPRSAVPGVDALEVLVNAGLALIDDKNEPRPQLAEAVPSLENGLWKLLPDGRMETTWTIRAGTQWHDGQPFTTEDLLFTAEVSGDKELAVFAHVGYDSIESIEGLDARTLRVSWKRPYVEADSFFSTSFSVPMPRHLLARAYAEDKGAFTQHPYWSQEFVGTGPFKLREWVGGSHIVLQANDQYALGRPKIDEVEVRFIPSSNTLQANVLAGTVEVTLGRALSLEQALQVRDQWRDGRVIVTPSSWVVIHPQLLNPSPPIVGSAQLRAGLYHAIDRQELVESLLAGLGHVAHGIIGPSDPEFPDVDPHVPRYAHDARRATQLIETLGYTRGADGLYQDAAAQKLAVEIRTTADNDIHLKTIYPVADFWQRIGVGVDPHVIPTQRQRDLQYRATFPGFEMLRGASGVRGLTSIHSSRAPLPENNFQITGNYSRYMNPEYDALYEKFTVTIPRAERMRVLIQIVQHLQERLIKMPLFFDAEPTMVANRLQGVIAGKQVWNAHEWEIKATV